MSKERELLQKVVNHMWQGELVDEIKELLDQPEQTEYIKTKKEPEIYFVKDEFGSLRPTFKNPKETPFLIDVLHGGGK
jgi:hypothetical protein